MRRILNCNARVPVIQRKFDLEIENSSIEWRSVTSLCAGYYSMRGKLGFATNRKLQTQLYRILTKPASRVYAIDTQSE